MTSQKAQREGIEGADCSQHKEMIPKIQAGDVYSRPGAAIHDYYR